MYALIADDYGTHSICKLHGLHRLAHCGNEVTSFLLLLGRSVVVVKADKHTGRRASAAN